MSQSIPFTNPVSPSKFLLFPLSSSPKTYINSTDRDEFFEMIWYTDKDDLSQLYLIPPFRSLNVSLEDKRGYLIAFKREYLEEDDKEFALDVFRLFNQQGQYSLMQLTAETKNCLEHLRVLMEYEVNHPQGTFLALKGLVKLFLLHLIRQSQFGFLQNDVNQKRVYDFCILLDQHYIEQRKSSFYSKSLNISEKRLNQILGSKMNKTIIQLVHARLILEAKRKLTNQELTVKEIAYELNFKDHSYFTRFFRQQVGVSPEAFKKQIPAIF